MSRSAFCITKLASFPKRLHMLYVALSANIVMPKK